MNVLFMLVSVAFADPYNSKASYHYGQTVTLAKCGTRAGSHWVDDGYPKAHLENNRDCGMRAVVVEGPRRECDPYSYPPTSCDPWSYKLRIAKTGDIVERDETQIGNLRQPRNTLMDVVTPDPKVGKVYSAENGK